MLRILLSTVMNLPHCGGLCTHLEVLRRELEKKKIDTRIVDGKSATFRHLILSSLSSLVKLREPRNEWLMLRCHLLKKNISVVSKECNLIHVHDPISAVASFGNKRPVITTVHGPMLEHAKEVGGKSVVYMESLERYEQECYGRSQYLIAVDTGQRDLLIKKGVDARKIKVVYNAVDVDYIKQLAVRSREMDDWKYFILARRLVPKNGVEYAVMAFLAWVGSNNVSLLIAGDGPLKKRIESIIEKHKEAKKVKLLGHVEYDELMPLMKNAIASIVPSIPVEGVIEATSLAVLESLALGVPVIASDIGGLSEIDGGTKILNLVMPGNVQSIIEKIDQCYKSNKGSVALKLEEHVRINFGVEKWIGTILEIYRKFI